MELCPKCRRGQGGAAETVATLVPGVDGSLEFEEVPMKGEGAASLIAVMEPVLSGCCREMKKLFINRFGKTRCVPCDADSMAARRLGPQLAALVMVLALFLFSGCGPVAFVPAYEGEPECGSVTALHAVLGEACDSTITVACDCEERRTLECAGGAWRVEHWGCAGGLGVFQPRGLESGS